MERRGDAPSVVHVRDTLMLADDQPVEAVARAAHVLSPSTPVYEALGRMRASSVQLAVVMDGKKMLGVISLSDIVKRVLPSGMTLAAGGDYG